MPDRLSPTPAQHPLTVALAVFLIAALISGLLAWQAEVLRERLAREQVADLAVERAQTIRRSIEHALTATYALAAQVRQGNGKLPNFEATAQQMLPFYPGAASLQLAPGGVVQRIVPLAGNERAIGHDLLQDPVRNKEAFLARDSGQLTLAGPFELVQGGLGAAGRLPVYLGEADTRVFWGFTTVLIRFPEVLSEARLERLTALGFAYELWRIHPDSGKRQTIATSGNKLIGPVDQSLELPNGHWTLSLAPLKGWGDSQGVAIKVALCLLFSLLSAYLAKLQVESRRYRENLEIQVARRTQELSTSEKRIRNMSEAAGAYLWEVDTDMVYSYVSGPSAQVKGYPPEALLGHTPLEFMPEEDIAPVGKIVRRAINDKTSFRLQHRDITPDGEVRWEEVFGAVYCNEDGKVIGLRGTGMSINERKQAENRIQRLTDLYAALSECNQAIVRCNSEAELFPLICRDVVEYGGMKMAWIGLIDKASGQIVPVARCGEGQAYLDGIDVSIDPANPHGRGTTGHALREGHPVWNQDFLNNPLSAPWRERALRFGFRASAALPLRRAGAVVGTLNIYAAEVNAFDADARKLLEEMATDVSYALDGFERNASLKLAAAVFEQGKEGIMITDIRGQIVRVNRAFSAITGYSAAEALGNSTRLLSSGRHDQNFYRELWDTIKTSGHWQGEIWNRHKDGHAYPVWQAISCVLGEDGAPSHYVGIFSDITRQKEVEARILHLAHFDALTGLPNRTLLNDRADHALRTAQRSHEPLAVLFIDLDHFKNINDTLGHRIGDALLVEIAQRMQLHMPIEATLSRQGGDEFSVVLPGMDADAAALMAEKLITACAELFRIEQHELVVTPSIGIAMYPADGADFPALAQCADTALFRAKQAGRNTYRFFTQNMQEHSARHLHLGNALRHALERNELHLHYQPQMALADGRIVGAEALLRWHHDELGEVSPVEFIPIAEDNGLILPIGEWVLRTAVRQMRAWHDDGLPPMVIAVNLSAVQFRHTQLPQQVTQILAEEGLTPEFLELELTESVAMEDPHAAIAVMDDLCARGIRMSIDDFGTGYSSLSYLKRLRVHKLKIDQSFVRDIGADSEDRAIVSAIIRLADSLGLHTIAEGVETAAQLAYLRAQGCLEVQGYHYSRPLPPDEFAVFVRAHGQPPHIDGKAAEAV